MDVTLITLLIIHCFLGVENSIVADKKNVPSPVIENSNQQVQINPIIIAHRGASGMYPEHTKLAYREAIKQGSDFIECDVVVTKDLKLYCNHDPWLSKVTSNLSSHPRFSGRRKTMSVLYEDPYDDDSYVRWNVTDWFIHDFTEEELRTLKRVQAKEGRDPNYDLKEGFCSFQEFIDIAKENNVGIYPELKYPFFVNSVLTSREEDTSIEELFLDIIMRNGYNTKDSKCFIQCFERKSIEYLKSKTKASRIYLLWEDEAHLKNLDEKGRLLRNKKMWSTALDWAKRHNVAGFGLDKNFISSKNAENYITNINSYMIDDAKENGLLTHVYTFAHDQDDFSWSYGKNPYLEYEPYVRVGADGLFVDFPETARSFLGTKGDCNMKINSASFKQYNCSFFFAVFHILQYMLVKHLL